LEAWHPGLAGLEPAGIAPQVMRLRIYLEPPLHAYPRTTNAWDPLAYPVPPLVIAAGTRRLRASCHRTSGYAAPDLPRATPTCLAQDNHRLGSHAAIRKVIVNHRKMAGTRRKEEGKRRETPSLSLRRFGMPRIGFVSNKYGPIRRESPLPSRRAKTLQINEPTSVAAPDVRVLVRKGRAKRHELSTNQCLSD
jgi:hypothetical protein